MKKIYCTLMVLMMFVFASCSKEDAKENTVCFAQCLLAKENGQRFAEYKSEEKIVPNEEMNILLKRLEKQDSLLQTIKAELTQANKQQDSTLLHSDSTTQEVPTTSQPIDCDTRVAEVTPETAPVTIVEESNDDYSLPEIREKNDGIKEKALSGLAGAALGAAATFMATKKLYCERLDVLIEYKLMQVCINNCGYDAEKKCAEGIMNMLCKEKLEVDEIEQRSRSCDIRR